jgi:hypothetical protein
VFGEVLRDADEVVGDDACLRLKGRPGFVRVVSCFGGVGWFARTIAGEGRFGLGLRLESPGSGLIGRVVGGIALGLLFGLG